jgi:hypothetical protein
MKTAYAPATCFDCDDAGALSNMSASSSQSQ